MVKINFFKLFLLISVLIFSILISLNFVSATDCYLYDGDVANCVAAGCSWSTNNQTVPMDPSCWINITTYNQASECGPYTNCNETTGGDINNAGCCWESGGYTNCWSRSGTNETWCENMAGCSWYPNDMNQNPSCENSIGCCWQGGCWSYDGDQTGCESLSEFCAWKTTAEDSSCYYSSGCCWTKSCTEVDGEDNCTAMSKYDSGCTWSGGSCGYGSGGGFGGIDTIDSCIQSGGWWTDGSTECSMPSGDYGAGEGGFMFAGEAHCWFADNQQKVCLNVTGCVYCDDSTTELDNVSSACYGHPAGLCQGHEPSWTNLGTTVTDIATDNLNCTHIQIRSACEYGPLPFCKWGNSSIDYGQYCISGTSTKKAAPPVSFCEHPDSKNNYSLCLELAENYMMPCKWADPSSNITNCSFNMNAIFGTGVEKEYEIITSEMSCNAAGGTWKEEYYLEGGVLKQDKWCEKGALFNYATGQAASNKGNCDTDCWACEFNYTGGNYNSNATLAEQACNNSALGYCVFTADTNAPNNLGWCDYPTEMDYGAGDCQTSCKDCELMKNPYTACVNSVAGCKWINDTDTNSIKLTTGICVENSKKTCDDDCFSCYDFYSCNASDIDCQWDDVSSLCKPCGYTGEICFNGVDDDGDNMVDCGDPDCSFDTSCGGSSFGNCAKYTTYTDLQKEGACNAAIAFGNENCTWINMSWEPDGHCGMPGEDCWQYDYDMAVCGEKPGCKNMSTSGGGGGFCDINMTTMNEMNCYPYTTEAACNVANYSAAPANCSWVTPDWGPGFCEFWAFAQCRNYNTSTQCADGNCTWNSNSGFCEVACFNSSMTNTTICDGAVDGLCEWRGTDNMCMPEHFDMMSGGTGAKIGCAQYDGNYTGCLENNFTCTWSNDTGINNYVTGTNANGWCFSKGEYELSGMMKGDLTMLGYDSDDAGVIDFVDIEDFGMRVTDSAYGFGMKIINLTDAALCNGYPLNSEFGGGTGGRNETTEFYWYLDTDGDSSSGTHCEAIGGSTNYTNFEFYISHIVKNTTSGIETKKQLYRCIQNSTGSNWIWVTTNIFVSDNKKFTCFESGAAFVTVEKEGLENFDTFNISASMRIFATTASEHDNSGGSSRASPIDSVGPSYYTPGTIDFAFVDCSNPDIKDSKCKNFQKFGFQMFEDCKNGVDDDGDGLADCSDPKCDFTPGCATGAAFNFVIDENDKDTPVVMFSKVDKMADAALVVFDTNEPANGSLEFYNQSSTCESSNLTATLNDLGDPTFEFDDYKPFHRVTLNSDNLGYDLDNSTAYYYKAKVCDPSGNCGTSKCLNFTTKKVNKNFIFRMDVPEGYTVDIPALDYSGNFTTTIGNTSYDIGIKTNSSVTKNINITVNYSDLSLKLVGADLYKPKTLDLENAFIADTVNETLGVNSSTKSWSLLLNDLGLGGSSDYVELEFPVAYDEDNNLSWYDDNLGNESDVTNYSNCSGSTSHTLCKIPTSLGFTVYGISSAAAAGAAGAAAGAGSAGAAAALAATGPQDYYFDITRGETHYMDIDDKGRFNLKGVSHTIRVIKVTRDSVTLTISSTSITVILKVGEVKEIDIDKDGKNDLRIELRSIYHETQGELYFKKIKEIKEEVKEIEEIKEKVKEIVEEVKVGAPKIIWRNVGIIALIIIVLVIYIIKKRSSEKEKTSKKIKKVK